MKGRLLGENHCGSLEGYVDVAKARKGGRGVVEVGACGQVVSGGQATSDLT